MITLKNASFEKEIEGIKISNNNHIPKYEQTVVKLNSELDKIIIELRKEKPDKENIEYILGNINIILEDFDVSYIPDINSDPGLLPFSHLRGLWDRMADYL